MEEGKGALNRGIRVVSIILHPLLMPVFGILILFYSGTYLSFIPEAAKRMITLIVAGGMFIIPLSLLPFFMYRKMISSVELTKRNERFVPLLVTAILYYFTFILLKNLRVSHLILSMLLSALITIVILMIIGRKFNISLHAAGVAGLSGFLLSLSVRYGLSSPVVLYGSFILTGLVGSVRLKQGAHRPPEIYTGYLVGFVCSFVIGILF